MFHFMVCCSYEDLMFGSDTEEDDNKKTKAKVSIALGRYQGYIGWYSLPFTFTKCLQILLLQVQHV